MQSKRIGIKNCVILLVLMVSILIPLASRSEKSDIQVADGFKYVVLDDGTAKIVGNTFILCPEGSISIPSQINGYTVTAIDDLGAIDADIYSISIPDTVVNITRNPFSYLNELRKITISPNHPVLALIDGVLFNKTNKSLISYPMGLADKLEYPMTYSIPQGIETICDYAFAIQGDNRDNSLNKVIIPDSVTSIGKYAFYNVGYFFDDLVIPDSVITIGDAAFKDAGLIYSANPTLVIPNSVQTIGDEAFYGNQINNVFIPESVMHIGAKCFDYDIYHKVADRYLLQCRTQFTVSDNNPVYKSIDGVLFSRDNRLIRYPDLSTRTEYIVPEGTISIDDDAFTFAESLCSLTIPASVKNIGRVSLYDKTTILVERGSDAEKWAAEQPFSWSYANEEADTSWLTK